MQCMECKANVGEMHTGICNPEENSSFRGLTNVLQNAILNITDDLATQDVLIEVKRGVDKWLWMLIESAK